MLGLLRESGIPAHLQSDAVLPGLESFVSLEVPSELLHRAKWVLESSQVSDGELTYLATRKLPGAPDNS
jgi:hypothetical protein